ncbi:alpha/beta hydrolase [Aquisalimonas sp.]|uniref:alpha/beta fold hydrolase n=1 Tax=unclassified Aquisalimonas TaxID=2644645 RepID=UPI0025C6D4F1|nr:alpha/beta hydrolase [Aquisalimonas sp.]
MTGSGSPSLRDQLVPWEHHTGDGFAVRGWHSPPSGRPVIHFIHGNGMCGLVYEAMLSRLARDYDLFLSDVQGHGNSDHGGAFRGWNRTAEICLDAWQQFAPLWKGVPVVGMGHSFGGVMIALMMGQRADIFDQGVLLDPVLFPPAMLRSMALLQLLGLSRRTPMARQAARRRDHWPDRDSAFKGLRGRGIFRGWQDRCLQSYVTHALRDDTDGVTLRCRPEREAEIFGSSPRRLWGTLGRVSAPVLMLHGADSYPFVSDAARRLPGVMPGIAVERMPGGHCFMQQDPESAAERVLAALPSRHRAA